MIPRLFARNKKKNNKTEKNNMYSIYYDRNYDFSCFMLFFVSARPIKLHFLCVYWDAIQNIFMRLNFHFQKFSRTIIFSNFQHVTKMHTDKQNQLTIVHIHMLML